MFKFKKYFKKAVTMIALSGALVMGMPAGVFASSWVQPKSWGTTVYNPDEYEGNAKITIDQVLIPQAMAGKEVQIKINVSGAENTVSNFSFHISYDQRLSIKKINGEYIAPGDAVKGFSHSQSLDGNSIVFMGVSSKNALKDGCIGTITFDIPADSRAGDRFPISIDYKDGDMFINSEYNDAGKLQMAYIFTKGIEQGYIEVVPALEGETGECTWKYAPQTSTLTISGNGAMADYQSMQKLPWIYFDDRDIIENVIIEDGVTHIGDHAFDCKEIAEITVPDTVESIGKNSLGYYYDSDLGLIKKDGFIIKSESCKEELPAKSYADANEIDFEQPGHSFDEGVITKTPTVTETGIQKFTCQNCGFERLEELSKKEPEKQEDPKDDSIVKPEENSNKDNDQKEPEKDNKQEDKDTSKKDRENQKGADGTALGKGASKEAAEKNIMNYKKENDPKGSTFCVLQPKVQKATSKSLKLSWKKAKGAKTYVVYGTKCGAKNKYQKIASLKKTSFNVKQIAKKKISKGTYYKFIIVALDKDNNVVSTSTVLHAATAGGKIGNYKSIKTNAKKNKISIKAKGKFKLKSKTTVQKKVKVKNHVGKNGVRYESDNAKIATVNKNGVVKGIKKGKCNIYAYTQNGVCKKIKVTVK